MATQTVERLFGTAPPRPTTDKSLVRRIWGWAVLAAFGIAFLGILGLALLALADFAMAGNGSPEPGARLAWVWDRGDHLHYAAHILQGRLLDLCPCSRRAAANQYYEAHFHALTPHQTELTTNTNPHTPQQWAEYLGGPFLVVGDWLHDSLTWLAGQRPSQQATVVMDDLEFLPPEIHIARGTQVTWRNIDDTGEAHTVTADASNSFGSDWILPDESFSHTFTERGRYVYYCAAHGGPGQQGMFGVVIVQ